MQNINVDDIIKKSKFKSFLKGEDGYSLVNSYADMPTDNMQVVEHLKNYYLKTKDDSVWKEFEKALILISEDKEFIFLVPLYIHSYLYIAKELDIYPVNISNIRQSLSKYIIEYNLYLENNKSWIGANMEGGLLGYMKYMINLIKENFGVAITGDGDSE